MYDPYQQAYIMMEQKKVKKKNTYLTAMVGMIVSVAGLYIVDVFFNILNKEKFSDIFKVRSNFQAYYATVIAGGINGILVVFLPPKVYNFAAVIILTTVYESIAKLTGLETLNSYELTRGIIRDIFIVNLVIYILKKLFNKDNNKDANKEEDIKEVEFEEIIGVTLLSSIVLNLSIVSTRYGINNIFGFER